MTGKTKELDATGLCCPGPLMRVKSEMDTLSDGDTLKITASDMGFYEDIKAWCRSTGHELLSVSKEKGLINAEILKGMSLAKQEGQPLSTVASNIILYLLGHKYSS